MSDPFSPLPLPPAEDNPPGHPAGDLAGLPLRVPEGETTVPELAELLRPRLSLFWGSQAPTRSLLTAATTIAAHGLPVRLFDGGNSFDGYFVARLARRLVLAARPGPGPADPYDVLDRMRLSRAFTCFQLAELIESAPAGPEPLFVLDLLATFYDESVPLRDSERLLATTLSHLRRLAAVGPVVVGAREPQTLVKERWLLLDQLQTAADAAWMLRSPAPEPVLQPRLF